MIRKLMPYGNDLIITLKDTGTVGVVTSYKVSIPRVILLDFEENESIVALPSNCIPHLKSISRIDEGIEQLEGVSMSPLRQLISEGIIGTDILDELDDDEITIDLLIRYTEDHRMIDLFDFLNRRKFNYRDIDHIEIE